VARLERLGARTTVCTRSAGSVGDPCYQRFREAVTAGALPLSCQGGDNGLTIEGGRTLGYELAEAIAGRGLDRVFVQVGGGALASALVQSLAEAARRGWLPAMPRVHAVQTTGAYPLVRAWRRFADDVLETLPHKGSDDAERARAVHLLKDAPAFEAVRARMARERSRYMRPWESEPRSVAHGILDDETYDFRAVVEGMARSGGWPVVASEEELLEANALAREATGIDADETGTAGLAGLLAMRRAGMIAPDERVAAIFSGARRN